MVLAQGWIVQSTASGGALCPLLVLKLVVGSLVGLRRSGQEAKKESEGQRSKSKSDADEPLVDSERCRGGEGSAPLDEDDLDDEGANDDGDENPVGEDS